VIPQGGLDMRALRASAPFEVSETAKVVYSAPRKNINNIRKLKLVLKGGKLEATSPPEGLKDWWRLYY
jgi:hypothetical protein